MDEAQPRSRILFRLFTTGLALALATGVNAAAAYQLGKSGTPYGSGHRVIYADLGVAPMVTVHARRLG